MKIINCIRQNRLITIPVMKWKSSDIYRSFSKLLLDSENWTKEQTNAWQLKAVSDIVDYAYEHVPAYKEKYDAVGYEKGSIRNWADFKKLPFTTKEEIKANFDRFISDEAVKSNVAFTSGSTGKPMRFLLDVATGERERALFNYYWRKYGFEYGEKCVLLRGQNVAKPEAGIYYKYDRFQNYKMFDSTYAADINNLEVYDTEIRKFDARYMQAYPSAAITLAKNYLKAGIKAPEFKTIFLGSEGTDPKQCEVIKEVFNADKVMYHYGHSECAVLALKYPDADILGFVPVYGYMELCNDNQRTKANEVGEIIATGFNKSMPFIRYHTGDYTRISNYQTDNFMRNFTSVELIEGRSQEYVITKSKRLIPVVWLCGQHMAIMNEVDDFQYEQVEVGKLIIHVTGNIAENIVPEIWKAYSNVVGNDLDIEVRKSQYIQKNPRGKRISMIQHVNVDEFRNK